jgi:hypothetical protein
MRDLNEPDALGRRRHGTRHDARSSHRSFEPSGAVPGCRDAA